MKRILTNFLAALMLLVMIPGTVAAVGEEPSDPPVAEGSQEVRTLPQNVERREARIVQYKERVTERLTEVESKRITKVCAAAQRKVVILADKTKTTTQARKDTYNNVGAKLDTIVEKLQSANVDTTDLEATIDEAKAQIVQLGQLLDGYLVMLDDLATIKCEDDPEGFKAALVLVRQQRQSIVAQAQSLREYVNVNIKTVLKDIRSQLADDQSAQ